jgi:hypothetical protein
MYNVIKYPSYYNSGTALIRGKDDSGSFNFNFSKALAFSTAMLFSNPRFETDC